jgi:hypothetical protein
MISLWEEVIRPQSERNILFEYRLLECRYVTLKSYMNKGANCSQSIVKTYSDWSL